MASANVIEKRWCKPWKPSAKRQREKGCGFCCYQEHPDKTFYPKEGYAFYTGFSKQIDVDAFDEVETDEIKYCPMCGKRLEEHHEADTLKEEK
jgi:hypothetical protein